MVEVVVLGSGTPIPDPDRTGPATAVVDGGSWVLVDCGRAATQQALAAGLDLRELEAVLITHHHSDHVSDLATLATTRWTAGAADPLLVVAPAGPSADFATGCLDSFHDGSFHGQASASSPPRPSTSVLAFDATSRLTPVFDRDGWVVTSVLVDHHPVAPAVGYRVECTGVTVAVSGDTAVCDGIHQLATGVDVLVHEALLTSAVRPSLLEWNAGARSVGELAATTNPGCLVLSHLIPAPASEVDEQRFVDEVRDGGFRGPTLVARDLLRVPATAS